MTLRYSAFWALLFLTDNFFALFVAALPKPDDSLPLSVFAASLFEDSLGIVVVVPIFIFGSVKLEKDVSKF